MKTKAFVILFIVFFLSGCRSPRINAPTLTPLPTKTPGAATVMKTSAPDENAAARAYLDAWKAENYPAMYALLTSVSRDAIKEEDFTKKYHSVAAEAALSKGIDYQILSALKNPQSAQVYYKVILHSVLVGDISRSTVMNLSLEAGEWKVQWDDALILPELHGGNHLSMDYKIPSRANIYDRNGHALVAQADAVAIGLNTGEVDPNQEDGLLEEIYRITGVHPESLRPKLDSYRSNNWYLPVGDVSAETLGSQEGVLSGFAGVQLVPFRTRYYFNGFSSSIAPHITGYMSLIQPDEVEHFQRLGYKWNERVGREGLELWGEPYLAGKRGGTLYVVSPDGTIVTILAETNPEPAQAIYTTIDRDLQIGVQKSLYGFKGAVVVLERDTGRVLAMASSPGFNPNLFEPTNANRDSMIEDLYNENTPLLNRATQGQYPLGSVFKIITMSAALKSGLYSKDTSYDCGYHFEELAGVTLNDWTWDHYQKDGKTGPSGTLSLSQGLMRSCNPYFWHIGLDLFDRGMTKLVSDMARGFGLGSPTGVQLTEEAGNIPDPASQMDATNGAIGQGQTLVTPIQVADFVAAVGNGGKLYRPSVIEKIVPPDGNPTYVFTSTVRATLPISGTLLKDVQDAMVSVISDPRGTAHFVFPNFPIPVAGKTGTAQDPPKDPDAWFVAYTYANRDKQPDIAVAVIAENAGEGSEIAAPIARGVIQLYFFGTRARFPWESEPGVWKTATPVESATPPSEETPTPEP
ncbi:MAG: penicillin-binding transpeptidase domain-containing protein [Omnitrophica WOR_2 bacterium]